MPSTRILGLAAAALLSSASAAPAAQPIATEALVLRDSRFTYYDMPTPLAGPCDLTTGPDGNIWVSDLLTNKVALIDPNSGVVEEFDIPYTTGPLQAVSNLVPALACVVQPGDDGYLYAATGLRNQLVRVNTTSKEIKVFTPNPPNLLGNLVFLNDMYAGPTGMYGSMTTANVIFKFDYQTETFTNYEVPTPLASPVGIYYASDGGVWFCEFAGNKIGRLDPNTGAIKEYPVPATLLGPAVSGIPSDFILAQLPPSQTNANSRTFIVRAETQGKYLWFTAFTSNAIGRIEMSTGIVTAFSNPSPLSFPTEDTVDSNGNIWFSTATQNTLNYLTPSTGKFTTIEQPDTLIVAPLSAPPAVDIAMHYGPGNYMWFTELSKNRVGRYQL